MSAAYPPIICALVLAGYVTGKEFFFNLPVILLASLAFFTCDSIKPFIVLFCTFIFQVSAEHTPQWPVCSDYYFTEWRLPILIALAALLLASMISFIVRTKLFSKIGVGKTPMLIPMLLLCVGFLLNGVMSETWNVHGFAYGIYNSVVFLVGFIFVYHGFSDEDSASELGKYFAYVSALVALVLIGQLADLNINDGLLVDGVLDRTKFFFGWGVTNTVGVSLAVLIPVIMYGAYKNRCGALYFIIATLTYVCVPFTLSRNALLASTAVYVICVLIFCLFGRKRSEFRFYTVCCVLVFGAIMILAWSKIYPVFEDFFNRGIGDSGRFDIWRQAYEIFLKNPVFGAGFNGLPNLDGAEIVEPAFFMPWMAHNTVFQLLCGMGIVGFAVYVIYRISSLRPFVVKPNLLKAMLFLSIGVLLAESLLDNFIFYITPTFHYTVSLAIAFKAANEEKRELPVKYERRW